MKTIPVLSAASALFAFSHPANATQTDNYGMHAVPTPGPVTIDGKLGDWDLSGQVLMTYDIETLRDVYSGRVATMYDADNLYISIHWKDPIPMGNIHDSRYTTKKGWAGDAVQIRVKTDRISHITAWYYAAGQEPVLQIDYGKSLTEPFGGGSLQPFRTQGWKMEQGVEMAFLKDADGKGYVQEIKMPWKLITQQKQFKAGDNISLGFELLWGEADWPDHRYVDNLQAGTSSREFFWTSHNSWGSVTLEPKGNLKLPEPAYMVAYRKATQGEAPQGPVDITYDLPKDARVSLAIDDASGNRVRNLIPALERKKGRNTEKWDGLDDNGKPVPTGEYSFKAIYHDGIRANLVMSFACPGSPGWATSDGRGAYYGDHTPPQAVAAGSNYVGLATPMGEAGKHIIGTDLNGQRLWGLPNRTSFDGGQISLATDGKTLWVASEGKKAMIYRANIATGRYIPWQSKTKDASGKEFDILEFQASELPGVGSDPKKLQPNMRSIAYHDGKLAVVFARENVVKVLNAETTVLLREYPVSAQAVAYTSSGELLILSQNRIMKAKADGSLSPLGSEVFSDGYGMATDAAGNIYVSVRGQQQNVKVFSPQGQLLREIGKRGGRPLVGVFDANAMRNPAGIAVDSGGRLWVTEETMSPKRTSIWDTKTGKLWKELVGTTTYAGAGALNPLDPTLAFSDNTAYRLNFKNATWAPIYSAGSEEYASHGVTANHPDNLFPAAIHTLTSRMIKRGNYSYIYTVGTSRNSTDTNVTLYDGKVFRSVAHIGIVPQSAEPAKFFAGQAGKPYAWVDANGDALVQSGELKFGSSVVNGQPVNLYSNYWGQLPDDEGTLPYMARDAKGQLLKDTLLKLNITAFNAVGAPVYDITQPQIVKLSRPILNSGEGMIAGGKNGNVYINQDPLTVVNRSGKIEATYPSRHISVHGSHKAKAARSGYLIGPSSILGMADMGKDIGEVFDLNGNLGENYLFTEDGLYIQTLFKDTRGYFDLPKQATRGMSMDATTMAGESFGGNFVKAPDGKTYLTSGMTDARLMEVSGLDSIKRLSGKFTYNATQYAEAQRLLEQKVVQSQIPKVLTIARSTQAPVIDGKSTEWPELLDDRKSLVEIQESPTQRYGRVSARYDADKLYLGYRVFAPRAGMINNGQDDRLLFKTGDAVDLMIGPENSHNGVGNLRLLLTQVQNQPVVVLNQKNAPNAAASEKFGFSSPSRTIEFDRVAVLSDVQLATSPIEGGYFVEAAIPWKTLGITPQSGLKLRGDFGVLFSDNNGTSTVSRQYWSNKSTGLVNDVPGEADLTPNLWGTFTLE